VNANDLKYMEFTLKKFDYGQQRFLKEFDETEVPCNSSCEAKAWVGFRDIYTVRKRNI